MVTSIGEGEIIEGSVTACLQRYMAGDEFLTVATFLVTRIGPEEKEESKKESVPIRIVFNDEQSDIVNPPRNTFVRAEIEQVQARFSHPPFSLRKSFFRLTNIAFVDRDSLKIVSRIPSPPKFWD
jgi:hypothetical protein